VELTVSWLEGVEERHVSRTMFLVDFQRVAAVAETTAQAPAQAPAGDAETPEAPGAPTLPSELELP
jgi:hypothetical protein